MNELSFIELVIKQTCRRSSYEFEMGSRQSSEDSSSIYSLEFLKSLFEKPRDNIHRLLKIPEPTLNGVSVKLGNGINLLNDGDFTKVEKKVFLDFLNKIKDMEPPKAKYWVDLQHYMHYVYRNFASCSPDPVAEVVSTVFLDEMREFVKILMEEDESQLYLRIFALLREYCIFAHWNFCKICDKEKSITKLFYYYEAMLSAAKCISSVFVEFEALLHKNYSVCWIDLNNCIFINCFFETEYVQNRICEFQENKLSPSDSPKMYELLENLRNLWIREQKRINELNEQALLDVTSEYYDTEVYMLKEHTKILSLNFWIDRTNEEKDKLNLFRMDHHIFKLLNDKHLKTAGPILDKNGQCICEECLVAKYKFYLDQDQINEITIMNAPRSTYCRKCQNIVDLNLFQRHVNSHSIADDHNKSLLINGTSNLSRIISEKIDLVNVGDKFNSEIADLAPVEQLYEKDIHTNAMSSKESFSKIGNDSPLFMKTSVFKEFLKHSKEGSPPSKIDQALNKRNLIKIKKDIFNSNGNFGGTVFKHSTSTIKKTEISPRDSETKLRELLKSGNKLNTPARPTPVKEEHCEHSCKQEEIKSELKKGCKGTCDHHKESKKCDCTYCEVFGTTVASPHKNSELRDRLRSRLNQRREKRTKDLNMRAQASNNISSANNPVKQQVKQTISNKIEERVPPPTHTVNPNPTPVVQLSNPSPELIIDDIHGLLNYIEGNTSNDKLAIAKKKAAKKERQRQKKEEERMKIEEEQRRKEAEERRKEEERKRAEELAKQFAEKARIKSLNSNGSKKDRKKNKNKNNQNNQKQSEVKIEKNVLEETIPAMVTIKRVAESGNSQPTVTITLKGSTPDQDKLLYTLVNGADSKTIPGGDKKVDGRNQKQEPVKLNPATSKKKNKKNKNDALQQSIKKETKEPTVFTKELKVTLAVDSSANNGESKKSKQAAKNNDKKLLKLESQKEKVVQEDLNLPMLRLPPGITITKVEGPVSNRNYKASNLQDQPQGSTINVGKSGVIVVDTEKLIQQNGSAAPAVATKSKKSRRKKNKNVAVPPVSSSGGQMITLKNPIFQNVHSKPVEQINMEKSNPNNECAPAAIFTTENGMVTIRSSRLQQSLNSGGSGIGMPMPVPSLLSDYKPVMGAEKPNFMSNTPDPPPQRMTSFNAQEILSGLPGIEITKVDKRSAKTDANSNKSCQTAQVSIIPTTNGDKFNLDKDDWTYDSVFTPKDILEDDMDADERELEAFKRFCQQSVPPKRKEKVAHLNVKDIVLKKKNDANCV